MSDAIDEATTFGPGKWLLAIGNCELPVSPDHLLGGDVMFQVWRKNEEPLLRHLVYRFRYYATVDGVFESGDKKSWFSGTYPGDLAAVEKMVKIFPLVIGIASQRFYGEKGEADILWLRCPAEEAVPLIVAAKKPWLHFQFEPINEKPESQRDPG